MARNGVSLVKVKSHAGCRLNERADALADLGARSEEQHIFKIRSGYVHAHRGGIEPDQGVTFSLEIALQTRVS